MGFQKGNTHGKGRPQGSQNKLTSMSKDFLKTVLFNEEEFLYDYKELDVNGRMELRIKLAPFILPKAKEVEEQYKDGPLFIDEPIGSQIYKEFGLDPDLLEYPHEFNLDEWKKHMREKSETEEKLT
tara:strand:- start:34 stop:411 length:378 start_codon:yes stop_codon:yes gene_type:complete